MIAGGGGDVRRRTCAGEDVREGTNRQELEKSREGPINEWR